MSENENKRMVAIGWVPRGGASHSPVDVERVGGLAPIVHVEGSAYDGREKRPSPKVVAKSCRGTSMGDRWETKRSVSTTLILVYPLKVNYYLYVYSALAKSESLFGNTGAPPTTMDPSSVLLKSCNIFFMPPALMMV